MIRILIEKEVTTRKTVNGDWGCIHETGDGEKTFGYAKEREKIVTETVKLLEQFVPDDYLDVPALIAVINGLQKPSPVSSEAKRCESRDRMGMQCWMWLGHGSDHYFATVSSDLVREEVAKEDARALAEWRRDRSVRRVASVKHESVIDEVVAVHGDEYIEVNNAHAFVGVSDVVLRASPHYDVCARIPLAPVTEDLQKKNWLRVWPGGKVIDGAKGMRIQSLKWIGDEV